MKVLLNEIPKADSNTPMVARNFPIGCILQDGKGNEWIRGSHYILNLHTGHSVFLEEDSTKFTAIPKGEYVCLVQE